MQINKILGDFGEEKACQYLLKNSYEIVERNFSCKQGEIDIIAKDLCKNELVFVEVKTRSNFHYGRPVDSVTVQKMRHLRSASKYYIYKEKLFNALIRFDIIEIFVKNSSFTVNHIKQIF